MATYKLTPYASAFKEAVKGGKTIILKDATQADLAFLYGKGGSALVERIETETAKPKASPKKKRKLGSDVGN